MDIDETSCPDCEEFHRPHFLILNMAVGGGFTSGTSSSSSGCSSSSYGDSCAGLRTADDITATLPATMFVDYVYIYDNGYTEVTFPSGTPVDGAGTGDCPPDLVPAPIPAAVPVPVSSPGVTEPAPVPTPGEPDTVPEPTPGEPDTVPEPSPGVAAAPVPVSSPGVAAPVPVPVPDEAGGGSAPVPEAGGGSVPAPVPEAGGGSMPAPVHPNCCHVCNDGGVSSIQNPNAVVALPSELASIIGAESATCGSLEQFAEIDAKMPQDKCYLLDVELIRIACGCPNAQAPGVSPTVAGGAGGGPSPPSAGVSDGVSGGGSGGTSSKGKSGKSGTSGDGAGISSSGKSGKSGKSSNGSKSSGDGAGSGTEKDAFFAASSTRPKGRRSRGSVVGATITAYGLAQLL